MKRAELSGSPALISAYGCTAGVYGRTYVVKWITVRRGLGLVFTQFSPEGHRASDRAVLAGLLRGLSWRR